MPQSERKQVWAGQLQKTSGGLTKSDLVLNKRGKLVSKKKSQRAKSENNLGDWLRKKGDKFDAKRGAQKPPKKVRKAARVAKASPKRKKEVAPSSPSKPGQDRNLRKITVGNILNRRRRTGINTASWPEWAKKLSKSKQQQASRWRKDAVSWRNIRSRM